MKESHCCADKGLRQNIFEKTSIFSYNSIKISSLWIRGVLGDNEKTGFTRIRVRRVIFLPISETKKEFIEKLIDNLIETEIN
jgi:hypothetical protein